MWACTLLVLHTRSGYRDRVRRWISLHPQSGYRDRESATSFRLLLPTRSPQRSNFVMDRSGYRDRSSTKNFPRSFRCTAEHPPTVLLAPLGFARKAAVLRILGIKPMIVRSFVPVQAGIPTSIPTVPNARLRCGTVRTRTLNSLCDDRAWSRKIRH